jgi:hypothetical protein
MREGPSRPGDRVRSQTTGSCLGPMARVVSVPGKGGTTRQVQAEKANESEPLMKCRKRRDVIETGLQLLARDEARGTPVCCPSGDRHEGGASSVSGSRAERGNLSSRCKGRPPSGGPMRGRVPMRGEGADRPVVAEKPGNAGRAKGSDCPATPVGQPARGGTDG